jgi:hypothetical protein
MVKMLRLILTVSTAFFFAITSIALAETKITTFNGEVSVHVVKDGKTTEEKVLLKGGEAVISQKTVDKVGLVKKAVSWKDIGESEQGLVAREPFAKFYVDNLWAARINRVVVLVRQRTGKNPSMDSVLEALGLPKHRPSGKGIYRLVPDDKSMSAAVPYVDENMNEYMEGGQGTLSYNPVTNPVLALSQGGGDDKPTAVSRSR